MSSETAPPLHLRVRSGVWHQPNLSLTIRAITSYGTGVGLLTWVAFTHDLAAGGIAIAAIASFAAMDLSEWLECRRDRPVAECETFIINTTGMEKTEAASGQPRSVQDLSKTVGFDPEIGPKRRSKTLTA